MRAWLLQGDPGSDQDELAQIVRQWAGRPGNEAWIVDCLRLPADVSAAVQAQSPDVLVLCESSAPAEPWLTELLAHGIGLVVMTSLGRAEAYRGLAEAHAIQLMPRPASVEGVGLAILNVLAALHRQRTAQARIDQLQQRLNDRIVIERAKGILGDRLDISEKEAYQRLRLKSRQERRQIRDIAQSLLDAQSLMEPPLKNGFNDLSHRPPPPPLDRPGTAS